MKTVLLIEDDAWPGELYADVLRAADYHVIHALDAMQGIEHLDEHPVDVIVLDLVLPEYNGIALLQQLRSYPDLAELPVILHSAVDVKESDIPPETWRAYGVVEYVSKVSARPQDLVRIVKRVLHDETI